MKIRRLEIKNFRGIHEMTWKIRGDMICLIGPNDSTKSTILCALEYLFYPNQNLTVSDVDFYNMKADVPIEISAIVSDLPKKLNSPQSEDKFGLHIGFFNPQNGLLSKQKQDGFVPVLQIRLQIEKDLEAKWFIDSLQDDGRDPLTIWGADRRALGIARIGQYVDSDLSWARDSALSRLTQKDDSSKISSFLADTERAMHDNIQQEKLSMLDQTINDVKKLATEIGVEADLQARVNRGRVNVRQGAIGLHDGKLPFTMRGLGSRRLLTMAIHKSSVANGAVILIDEIENNLEPYRLRHLIRQIRPDKPDDKHQVIFTTHSPVAVVECKANELYVVRSSNGATDVKSVTKTFEGEKIQEDIQKIARSISEAFLSPRVIICEGKTEAGFLIALDEDYWTEKHQDPNAGFTYQTMAEAGVMPVESPQGGGSESPNYACAMAKLGYRVAYFGDSDRGDETKQDEQMIQSGVNKIFRWEGNTSIEERLCLDLPWEALKKLIELAETHNGEKVWNEVRCDINGKGFALSNEDDLDVLRQNISEKQLREIIGILAKGYKVKNGNKEKKRGEWFKRRDKSEYLGGLVAKYLDQMQDTATYRTLSALEQWAYEC